MAVDSLTIESATHNHAAAALVLTQLHVLAIDACDHGHASDAMVILNHTFDSYPQESTHTLTSAAATLSGVVATLPALGSQHIHRPETITLTLDGIETLAADLPVGIMDLVVTLKVDIPPVDPPVWADPQPLREVREVLPTPVVVNGIPTSP